MRYPVRSILITAAALAAVGACATKPPPPEPTPPPPKSSSPAAVGASGQAGTSADGVAGGGASADGAPGTAAGSATPPAQAQTAEERRAALDKQLNDSLGSFDARLRKEQQRVAQERDARQATVPASTVSTGSTATTAAPALAGVTAKPATDQTASVAGSTTPEGAVKSSGSHGGGTGKRGDTPSTHAGDLKSDNSGGDADASSNGNGALANEVPDGNDDDIVARRLRKAAEQETDPDLRDKLWKEYVEYKKNAQVR